MTDQENTRLNLSELIELFEITLYATNQTKVCVLNTCTETGNLLKNWCLPEKDDFNQCFKPADSPLCTCVQDSLDANSNLHQLAQGIEDIVENAQKLREKITIKNSAASSNKSFKTASNHSLNSKHSQLVHTVNSTTYGCTPKPRIPLAAKKLSSSSLVGKPKKSVSSGKSTYQRDFSPRSQIRPQNGHSQTARSVSRNGHSCVSSTSQNKQNPTTEKQDVKPMTMAQLDALMSRVAVDATLYSVPPEPSSNETQVNECLVHGCPQKSNLTTTVQRQVELAEAIDELGVPSDLVKVLRVYHRFLAKHLSEENVRPSEPAAKFMKHLTEMNQTSWNEAMSEPVANLFSKYEPLYKEVSEETESTEKKVLSNKFQVLEQSYRKCCNHDSSWLPDIATPRHSSTQLDSAKLKVNSDTAGIWNVNSRSTFRGMEEALCIRYRDKAQLRGFHDNIQRIQQQQFQVQLLEILVQKILPQLEEMNPNNPTFCLAVKTFSALSDISNLKMPVLIREPLDVNNS